MQNVKEINKKYYKLYEAIFEYFELKEIVSFECNILFLCILTI